MDLKAALHRIMELEDAIRAHRDARGDDRCWMDDEELYGILPEGYTAPERDCNIELENCKKFIATRHNNPSTIYVSPQREIERLQGLVTELKALVLYADKQIVLAKNEDWKKGVDWLLRAVKRLIK